jgi:hypothetical protein
VWQHHGALALVLVLVLVLVLGRNRLSGGDNVPTRAGDEVWVYGYSGRSSERGRGKRGRVGECLLGREVSSSDILWNNWELWMRCLVFDTRC